MSPREFRALKRDMHHCLSTAEMANGDIVGTRLACEIIDRLCELEIPLVAWPKALDALTEGHKFVARRAIEDVTRR